MSSRSALSSRMEFFSSWLLSIRWCSYSIWAFLFLSAALRSATSDLSLSTSSSASSPSSGDSSSSGSPSASAPESGPSPSLSVSGSRFRRGYRRRGRCRRPCRTRSRSRRVGCLRLHHSPPRAVRRPRLGARRRGGQSLRRRPCECGWSRRRRPCRETRSPPPRWFRIRPRSRRCPPQFFGHV